MTTVSFRVNRPQRESSEQTDLKEREEKANKQTTIAIYPVSASRQLRISVLGIIAEISSEIFQNFVLYLFGKKCVGLGSPTPPYEVL